MVPVERFLCAYCEAHLYWAHIIDPPVFRPVTWWDPSPPISNNGTDWVGGVWIPPTAEQETEVVNVTNVTFVTDLPPLCFSTLHDSGCVPVQPQLHLVAREHDGRVNYTLLSIPGMHGSGNDSWEPYAPDLPRCMIKRISADAAPVWQACHGRSPLVLRAEFGTVVDWGPHGVLWDKVDNRTVPFGRYNHSLSWHGGGSAGPVLQFITNGDNTTASTLHKGVWRIGLAFMGYNLGSLILENYTSNYIKQQDNSVMVCTSHPYVFALAQNASFKRCKFSHSCYSVMLSEVRYKTCISMSDNVTFVFPLRRRSELWIPVNLTRDWEGDSNLLLQQPCKMAKATNTRRRTKRFLGWLIFALVGNYYSCFCHCCYCLFNSVG